MLNFLLEECAVGVWRRHILDPLEEEGGTKLAFWRHYLGDKVVDYVLTLQTTHDLHTQAHTITLTSVRDKDLTSVAMKKLTDQDQIGKKASRRARLEGKLHLEAAQYGQTRLVLTGKFRAEETTFSAGKKLDIHFYLQY